MESSAVKPLDGTRGTHRIGSAVLSGSSASSLSEVVGFSLAVDSRLDFGRHSFWLCPDQQQLQMSTVVWTHSQRQLSSIPISHAVLFCRISAACTTENKQEKTIEEKFFVGSEVMTLGELALIASSFQFIDRNDPACLIAQRMHVCTNQSQPFVLDQP